VDLTAFINDTVFYLKSAWNDVFLVIECSDQFWLQRILYKSIPIVSISIYIYLQLIDWCYAVWISHSQPKSSVSFTLGTYFKLAVVQHIYTGLVHSKTIIQMMFKANATLQRSSLGHSKHLYL